MVSDNGAKMNKMNKLTKLTQLENEVTKLSEQLKTNKKTISLLKKSLTERDLRIHELELKLNYAQQSLLKKTIFTIHQCQDLVKNGIDEKIINPALTQIQLQIEVIQGIIHEAKTIISKKKTLINESILTTSDKVHQCPDKAIRYFENCVIAPSRILVNRIIQLIDNNLKASQYIVEQKIVYPGKSCYDRLIVTALELRTQSQTFFQAWLTNTVLQKIETLTVIEKELRINTFGWRNMLMAQLKLRAEQSLNDAVEAIKKSPFWDGKRKMGTA